MVPRVSSQSLLCKSPPCFWDPNPSTVPSSCHSVRMSFKHQRFPSNVQVCKLREHSYITAECVPQHQPWEIRNRRTEAHRCLHVENTISPRLARVLCLQTVWTTWTVSWDHKSSQAFQVGMLGKLLCGLNIWNRWQAQNNPSSKHSCVWAWLW